MCNMSELTITKIVVIKNVPNYAQAIYQLIWQKVATYESY